MTVEANRCFGSEFIIKRTNQKCVKKKNFQIGKKLADDPGHLKSKTTVIPALGNLAQKCNSFFTRK